MSDRVHCFETLDGVTEVLTSATVAPPARPGDGSTLELRAAMARFAAPADHPARRASVDTVIEAVALDRIARSAVVLTTSRLAESGARVDAIATARTVTVTALAAALELIEIDDVAACERLAADVGALVAVIGHGASPDPESDAATERLLSRGARAGHDPVAAVSLLYQCYDATAALVTTTLHGRAVGRDRVAAVPRTVRIALEAGRFGEVDVAAGDQLIVEIGRVGLEFGSGAHECPGRRIAETIAAAIVATIGTAGFTIDTDDVELDADGRPTTLTMIAEDEPTVSRPGADGGV